MWKYFEKRFSLSNGSRKYKLIKDVYDFKQSLEFVRVYYTKLRILREEIDVMSVLFYVIIEVEDVKKLFRNIEI